VSRRLAGGILPGPLDHRTAPGRCYLAYCLGKIQRYGTLPTDGRVILREAGLAYLELTRVNGSSKGPG